jgi:hypothetical protein
MSDWISVRDRLPTKSRSQKQWLVYRRNGTQAAAWFNGKFFSVGFTTFKDVTHWRQLPQPPEGDE